MVAQISDLRDQMAAWYDRLGMPSWPDPHPDGGSPALEEYSRLTDPARYRVVHARAEAWVESLRALPEVEVETLASEHGVKLTSSRPGTLPLLLLLRTDLAPENPAPMAILEISVTRPAVTVDTVPDCGCDACDYGSDDSLDTIDATISWLIGGPSVLLRGPGWHAEWHPGGGSSGGNGCGPDHGRMMELCRRLAGGEAVPLPEQVEAFVGRAWVG